MSSTSTPVSATRRNEASSSVTTPVPIALLPSNVLDSNSVMVTNLKLTGHNYLAWSKAVEMFIMGRGKDDYLYGNMQIPLSTDATYRQWKTDNAMIMSWLISSMTPEIGNNFILYSSAAEIWKATKELYSQTDNVAEIYELETQVNDLKQGDLSVSSYYSQLTLLWQQIDTYETHNWGLPADAMAFKNFIETKRVFRFLQGLHKDFDSVRSRLLGTKPFPTLNSVFSEVRLEESRIRVMMSSV